jgi:hypothetical protein
MADSRRKSFWMLFAAFSLLAGFGSIGSAQTTQPAAKTLIDYFLPTPIVGKLTSDVWGAPGCMTLSAYFS